MNELLKRPYLKVSYVEFHVLVERNAVYREKFLYALGEVKCECHGADFLRNSYLFNNIL